jgi:hypothetical protein
LQLPRYKIPQRRERHDDPHPLAYSPRFLHANGKPRLRIEAMTPRGKFTLTAAGQRPVVFVSGGAKSSPFGRERGRVSRSSIALETP